MRLGLQDLASVRVLVSAGGVFDGNSPMQLRLRVARSTRQRRRQI